MTPSVRALSLMPRRPALRTAAALGRRRFRRFAPAIGSPPRALLADVLGASESDVERWCRLAFEHAACDQLEYLYLRRLSRETLPSFLELRGLDHLRGALDEGRGAILYSGHVRGHYVLFAALGLLGLRPNVVGMPLGTDAPASALRALQQRDALLRDLGCTFLDMASGDFAVGVRAAKALRRNEVVTFEIDHTHSGRNLESTFLGRRARFPLGPLLVARSTGAPMLPFWLHRPGPGARQVADLGEPIRVGDDLEAALRAILAPLEESIRAHPESWATWLFPEQHVWVTT